MTDDLPPVTLVLIGLGIIAAVANLIVLQRIAARLAWIVERLGGEASGPAWGVADAIRDVGEG